ncbi:hypothetical protein ACM26V_17780 [Salipaludibacillus sp. HK11]|uniref:hypothetical protein n=1 Tax=Salipaludibacillus sp. HK11 TaxID=3394320 RepID=UPI0039FD699C
MSTHKTFARKKPTITYSPKNEEVTFSSGGQHVQADLFDKNTELKDVSVDVSKGQFHQHNENNSFKN